jgi:hypothetical protein
MKISPDRLSKRMKRCHECHRRPGRSGNEKGEAKKRKKPPADTSSHDLELYITNIGKYHCELNYLRRKDWPLD